MPNSKKPASGISASSPIANSQTASFTGNHTVYTSGSGSITSGGAGGNMSYASIPATTVMGGQMTSGASTLHQFGVPIGVSVPPVPSVVRLDSDGVIDLTKCESPVIIRSKDGDLNLSRLGAMISRMEYLICALETALEVTPNNPQLVAAYEEFRMVEELTRD